MPNTTKSPSAGALPPVQATVANRFTPGFQAAMQELLKAYELAVLSDFDPWELAVEIARLRAMGVTETDLRWLARSGYIAHAREVTDLQQDGRKFLPTGNLSFAKRTCFVLTATGAYFAKVLLDGETDAAAVIPLGSALSDMVGQRGPEDGTNEDENGQAAPLVPHWDAQRHELRVGGQLVKRFKGAAANQETILAAFEEEGWPPRIDDPLPPQAEQDSKRRLNDTIKCLNKNQKLKLLCFHGDGTGEGVLWNFTGSDEADSSCPAENCAFRGKTALGRSEVAVPSADVSPRFP